MKHFIGCDAHKRYSVFVVIDEHCRKVSEKRVSHDREEFRAYLQELPAGAAVALEAGNCWYWMVDELEASGHPAHLAQALEAKKRMGRPNKTDHLDAEGLAILLRNGSLPEVWIPPLWVRDERHLLRTRMVVRDQRTALKCRVHGVLAQYGLSTEGISDLFGERGHRFVELCQAHLPEQTGRCVAEEMRRIDGLTAELESLEQRIAKMVKERSEVRLLKTLPGVGPILAPVMALEIGDIGRFARAENLASYAGLVPRVYQSGNRRVHGSVAPNVNRYLKWAFVEAASVVVQNQRKLGWRHAARLYLRLKPKKGYAKAVVAVARHLAEAAYWVLTKQEDYKEPRPRTSSKSASAASSARG